MICASVWIVPLTTGILGWRWNVYEPVTGNWCWIGSDHESLRYALTHGWRFGIIIISFWIYVFVFTFMHRQLKGHSFSSTSYSSYDDIPYESSEELTADGDSIELESGQMNIFQASNQSPNPQPKEGPAAESPLPPRRHRRGMSSFSFTAPGRNPTSIPPTASEFQQIALADDKRELDNNPSSFRLRRTATKVDRDVWQMVLLNLYPVTYFLLWVPGLANRIAEANDHPVRALSIMQCSTQYIGLANAAVYMYKEHRKDIRDWSRRMRRVPSEDKR